RRAGVQPGFNLQSPFCRIISLDTPAGAGKMKAVTSPVSCQKSQMTSPPHLRKTQPTLYDVSRVSAVSSATVSRVFSGTTRVSDEVRKRVIDAAHQLGYEPSHAARALA